MVGNNMIGKYVIVRGCSSGVFSGILKERDGNEVCLNEVDMGMGMEIVHTLSDT